MLARHWYYNERGRIGLEPVIASIYGQADGNDLRKRISSLPGFGDMKLKSLTAVLAKRFGVEAAQEIAPNHPTLGDVDSPEALEEYQAKKRAHKAEMRAKHQA